MTGSLFPKILNKRLINLNILNKIKYYKINLTNVVKITGCLFVKFITPRL